MHTTPHRRLARKAPAPACSARRRLGGLYAPELLESRIAPAAFVVTSLVDDGSDGAATTLREAIGMANAHPGADTVSFLKGLTGKIPLVAANGAIAITDTLTIKGPGIDLITISGGDMIRIFKIDDGNDMELHPVSISGLTFVDGKAVGGSGSGGAIYSREPLTLTGVVVASSTATLTGGGVYAFGGGVYVQTKGNVVVTGSQFIGNHADLSGGGLFLNG